MKFHTSSYCCFFLTLIEIKDPLYSSPTMMPRDTVKGTMTEVSSPLGGTTPLSAPLHLPHNKADVIKKMIPALAMGMVCRTREEEWTSFLCFAHPSSLASGKQFLTYYIFTYRFLIEYYYDIWRRTSNRVCLYYWECHWTWKWRWTLWSYYHATTQEEKKRIFEQVEREMGIFRKGECSHFQASTCVANELGNWAGASDQEKGKALDSYLAKGNQLHPCYLGWRSLSH